jgi:hypothetical protein
MSALPFRVILFIYPRLLFNLSPHYSQYLCILSDSLGIECACFHTNFQKRNGRLYYTYSSPIGNCEGIRDIRAMRPSL